MTNKLFTLTRNNKIQHTDIALPVHVDSSNVAKLMLADNLISEAVSLSGTLKVPASSIPEAIARQDAEQELSLICDQVIEILDELGLGANFGLFRVENAHNENDHDYYYHPSIGLSVEIYHLDEVADAAA